MREKGRTNSLNGAFGLSVDSIFPCSSWPPFLGLLNVDSNNKEHSKLGSPFTKASFSLHPSHFLFLHSCWLDPDYLLKLSFTVVLTTGHLFIPLPHPTILKSSCSFFFLNSPFSGKTKQKPSLNFKSHFPHKKKEYVKTGIDSVEFSLTLQVVDSKSKKTCCNITLGKDCVKAK